MKTLLPLVKSYVKNSTAIIADLKDLQLLPEARIFSADANSMYTNIDTPTGLASIREFIADNAALIPPDFPMQLFLSILQTVMENNIFSFSDTYWLQLSGTAMGTPAACAYATVSYGQHENKNVLFNFSHCFLYYKRYIDDILGIWVPPQVNPTETWMQFKNALNNWGKLEWVIEEPSKQTTFLDLNIKLQGSSIITSTYQKSMNLYLYIPPLSAHPPSCFKGLITGELKRYWSQNSAEDFQEILAKFIKRLHDRGHSLDNLVPLLQQAAAMIDSPTPRPTSQAQNSTLYIHWQFHPKGIQRQHLRKLYDEHLKPHLDFDGMTVAISRPKNLRDILSSAKLRAPEDLKIQEVIDSLKTTNT